MINISLYIFKGVGEGMHNKINRKKIPPTRFQKEIHNFEEKHSSNLP